MRVQAFEFMDLPQTPRFMRDSVVESLGNSLRWSGAYDNATAEFCRFYQGLRNDPILDLCSGSGEPVAMLLDALDRKGEKLPRFLISDLFPMIREMEKVIERFPENVQAVKTPLDASNVPDGYPHSARMVIGAFHHFPPSVARSILRDSAEQGKPMFILEPMTRGIHSFLKLAFFFMLSTITNPLFSKQDRILKAMFTYLFPVIPLMAIWDGIVSVLRMYTEEELLALTSGIDTAFQWRYTEIRVGWGNTMSVFTGTPHEAPKPEID